MPRDSYVNVSDMRIIDLERDCNWSSEGSCVKDKMSEMPNIDTIQRSYLSSNSSIPLSKDFNYRFLTISTAVTRFRRNHGNTNTVRFKGFSKKRFKFQVYFSKNNGMTENNNTREEEARKPARKYLSIACELTMPKLLEERECNEGL